MSAARFSGVSRIETSAPGRCGLIGNPSDMYSGTVISCSIQERASCVIDLNAQDHEITLGGETADIRSADDLTIDGGALDLIKAAIAEVLGEPSEVKPFKLSAWSEIPRQSGLAGSTALLAAIIGALTTLTGKTMNPYGLAETVRSCEFYRMKTLCGFQDAYMSVFGGLQCMDFRGKSVADNNPNTSPLATMEPLHERMGAQPILIVAYTGVMHNSGETHASLYQRYCDGDTDAIQTTAQFAEFGRRGKRPLVEGDWTALASLMTENQNLIRSVQHQNPANEKLIDAALDAGALAAKLAGAGGGGSILALATDDTRDQISNALTDAGAAAVLYPNPTAGLTVNLVR